MDIDHHDACKKSGIKKALRKESQSKGMTTESVY